MALNNMDSQTLAIRLSKKLFAGVFGGVFIIAFLFGLIIKFSGATVPMFINFVPLILIISVILIKLKLVGKMWTAIQDGHARTTPNKAVGFLLIPFFNFYWVFQAFWGFSKDYNALISRRSVDAPNTPEGLYLTYAILSVALFFIPQIITKTPPEAFARLIFSIFIIAWYIISLLMIIKICDAVNSIPVDKIKEIQAGKAAVIRRRHFEEASPEPSETEGEALEEERPSKKPLSNLKKELRSWGIGLMVLGIVHLFVEALNPAWGIIIIVIGIINMLVIKRGMFIVNGIALLLVGVLNLAAAAETSYGWAIFGILQIIWGIQEIRKFKRYK